MTTRLFVALALVVLLAIASLASSARHEWTSAEIEELRSLSIAALEPLPADPTNRVADDPRAIDLGRRLFFDTRLSANGRVACSTCHQTERGFQDGVALAVGVGTTARRTMPIAGMARAPFLFWDGRKDSLWAQALGPLESAVEHGGTRAQYAHVVADAYAAEYEQLFGALPDLSGVPRRAGPVDARDAATAWAALSDAQREAVTRVFVNIGKAIAAFERRIDVEPSRFDQYVATLTSRRPANLSRRGFRRVRREPENISGRGFSPDEVAGLRLFIGRANCTQCHNGPLFTNNDFHNTGVPPRAGLPNDEGRLTGATLVARDEFNCRSRWSDAPTQCAELDFLVTGDHTQARAYKVPSLRNVAERAPYMDAGQFATMADVLDHYNRAPAAAIGHSELQPLRLTARDLRQLEAFLRTLSSRVLGEKSVTQPATERQ